MSSRRLPGRTRQHGRVARAGDALWGAQTQRAVQNFPISGLTMPRGFIRALGLVKWAAAGANLELGRARPRARVRDPEGGARGGRRPPRCAVPRRRLPDRLRHEQQHECERGDRAPREPVRGRHRGAPERSRQLQPEQQRRHSRPRCTCRAALAIAEQLLPALKELSGTISRKAADIADIVKTGRTHLMDAMPLTLGQELGAWRAQIEDGVARLQSCRAAAALRSRRAARRSAAASMRPPGSAPASRRCCRAQTRSTCARAAISSRRSPRRTRRSSCPGSCAPSR